MYTVKEKWAKIKETFTTAAEEVSGYQQKCKMRPWISNEVFRLSEDRKILKKVKDISVRNKKVQSTKR